MSAPAPAADVQRSAEGSGQASVQREDAPAEEEEEATAQTFVQRQEEEAPEEEQV
jgi:hypothetical protein